MGMEGFSQPSPREETDNAAKAKTGEAPEQRATPEANQKITRDQMESLVSSIDPKNNPDSWRAVKKELDASGWDYKKESVQYDRLVDDLMAPATRKADYASVKEIMVIFGPDALSESRRAKIEEQAREGAKGAIRGSVDKEWLKSSVEGLKLAGVPDTEIADLVYERMTAEHIHYSAMPEYFPIVPGLADKALGKR